jgi:hypothetical protein
LHLTCIAAPSMTSLCRFPLVPPVWCCWLLDLEHWWELPDGPIWAHKDWRPHRIRIILHVAYKSRRVCQEGSAQCVRQLNVLAPMQDSHAGDHA